MNLRPTGLLLLVACIMTSGCVSDDPTYDYSSSARHEFDDDQRLEVDRPPNAKTLHVMARIFVHQGRDNEAKMTLIRIIRGYPEFLPAYNDLAEVHLREGRLGRAIEALEMGLRVSPDDPVLLNNLGMCWMLKGDHAEAFESFKSAAAANPDDARYRGNMAAAVGLLGRYDESISLYKQIVQPADAHHNLGVICEARGDEERAAYEFEMSKKLRRGNRRLGKARVTS